MPKRILLIDDEKLVVMTLARLLKRQGYEVITALTGKKAIETVEKTDLDLIISDIRMPDLDGIEAIIKMREIVKESKRQAIPEVLITGYASDEAHERAKELNVADYIYKPFDTKAFLGTVKRNLKT